MTTRAARIWNGTAWEDLAAPVGVAPVSYQSTQPSSPQTGDIWIDSSTNTASSGIPVNYQATAPVNPSIGTIWIESDIDVPSVGQNLSYRWRKIAAGGETSLSGNDSFGLPLNYTPNYEQFFLNGMLLYRDSDYTASTGTTITGFPALAAGDVIEVLAIKAEPLADTYTQAQTDSKYVSKTVGGLNLVVPTSVTGGTVSANGAITVGSAVTSVVVDGAFSAAYDNYEILWTGGVMASSSGDSQLQLRLNGSSANYTSFLRYTNGSTMSVASQSTSQFMWIGGGSTGSGLMQVKLYAPFLPVHTRIDSNTYNSWNNVYLGSSNGVHAVASSYTGFTVLVSGTGSMTGGTIRIYGYNNGA